MNLVPKSWREVGVRTDNLVSGLVPYTLLAVVLISGLFLLFRTFSAFSFVSNAEWQKLYPSLAILVAIATVQELFFRGYLIPVLKSFSRSAVVVIFIDALLFALLHTIFPQPAILVPAAFLSGVAFATAYYYYPNVILASLVHTLLLISQGAFCHFGLISC